MIMPIQTPNTSAALVKIMLKAGYIEQVENFPVVYETKDAYWFVCYNDNEEEWMVSAFYLRSQEFLCYPVMVDNDYKLCVKFLHAYIAEMLI
jgi:hypothetical protein